MQSWNVHKKIRLKRTKKLIRKFSLDFLLKWIVRFPARGIPPRVFVADSHRWQSVSARTMTRKLSLVKRNLSNLSLIFLCIYDIYLKYGNSIYSKVTGLNRPIPDGGQEDPCPPDIGSKTVWQVTGKDWRDFFWLKRSRISENRLTSIMVLHLYKDITDNTNFIWCTKRVRRRMWKLKTFIAALVGISTTLDHATSEQWRNGLWSGLEQLHRARDL